jgi:N-acetylglucosaminyl-diphospho-decaprenol L-rhamnosyltransferase
VDVDWLMGAAFLVRRTAAEDAGPLDEEYFLYFEDVDWCLRFWERGWRVRYLPVVECLHRWSRASRKGGVLGLVSNPLARRHLRSSIRFFRRHGIYCARPQNVRGLTSIPVQGGPHRQSISAAEDDETMRAAS